MRRLQQKWCSIAVSSALVAMVGAAQAASLDSAAVAKSDSPALKAFESIGRMTSIVGFREVPAVTYEAPVNPWWDNVFYQGQKQLYGGARSNRRNGGGIGGFFSRLFNGGNLPSSRTRCYDFMW